MPLERISPSHGETLRACPLQLAYQRDPSYAGLRRESRASCLGITAHELSADVARGRFDRLDAADVQTTLLSEWESKLTRAEARLTEAALGPVPPPERWPNYNAIRRRLLRSLGDEATARRGIQRGGGPPRTLPEEALAPPNFPIYGRADRIERDNEEVTIVDLKTGLAAGAEIADSHVRQLLAYACLWHAAHGSWPAQIAVQRLDGSRILRPVDTAEAEAIGADLLASRERFNATAASMVLWSLATPSQEVCMRCDFRAACPAFFGDIAADADKYRRHVLGTVQDVTQAGAAVRVDLGVLAGSVPEDGSSVRVLSIPADRAPTPDTVLAVVDALPTPAASELRIAWDSQILPWPGSC